MRNKFSFEVGTDSPCTNSNTDYTPIPTLPKTSLELAKLSNIFICTHPFHSGESGETPIYMSSSDYVHHRITVISNENVSNVLTVSHFKYVTLILKTEI